MRRFTSQPQANGVFHGSQLVLGETTSLRSSLTAGMVTRFGIERTGAEEANVDGNLKREPRRAWSCAAQASSARDLRRQWERSRSDEGARFAAMPKVTSHTSPDAPG